MAIGQRSIKLLSRRTLMGVSGAIFCVLLTTALGFSPSLQMPSQLDDESFWKLVNEASEPSGEFFSENFVSNELGYQWVIPPALERLGTADVYLGVGPEQNFTYIAAFHPRLAFIVDIRRQNMMEHLLYKALFELSPDRPTFLSLMFARRFPDAPAPDAPPARLFSDLEAVPEDTAWLETTLESVFTLLTGKHHFELSEEDRAAIEHVYREFAAGGTALRYSVRASAVRGLIQPGPAGQMVVVAQPGAEVSPDNLAATVIIPAVPTAPGNLEAALAAANQSFPAVADVVAATDATGKNWNFLASEENYQSVRNMHLRNLIIPIVGDFAGPHALKAVGEFVRQAGSTVSVFYISNVEQYLTPPAKLQMFYQSVATLPLTPSSIFIRSVQAQGPQPGVAQSSFGQIQRAVDAVLAGVARTWSDILRISN